MRLAASSALAVTGLLVSQVDAQTIRGHVLDGETGRPIVGASVLLVDTIGAVALEVLANDSGRFVIASARAGRFRLQARALGYYSVLSDPLALESRRTRYIELRLRVDAVELAPLKVVATPRITWLDDMGFYMRRESGMGKFFTREDFESRRPFYVSDILRNVPGVVLRPAGNGNTVRFMRSQGTSAPGKGCAPAIWIDGIIARGALDSINPNDVEAIEVYRGPSQLPSQYGGTGGTCGAILVWTRRGRE